MLQKAGKVIGNDYFEHKTVLATIAINAKKFKEKKSVRKELHRHNASKGMRTTIQGRKKAPTDFKSISA